MSNKIQNLKKALNDRIALINQKSKSLQETKEILEKDYQEITEYCKNLKNDESKVNKKKFKDLVRKLSYKYSNAQKKVDYQNMDVVDETNINYLFNTQQKLNSADSRILLIKNKLSKKYAEDKKPCDKKPKTTYLNPDNINVMELMCQVYSYS